MINNFKNWERLNEQKGLDVDPKKSKKLARKQNKRKFRTNRCLWNLKK